MSGLSGVGTARVHDHPRVGELDDARVLLQHDLAAKDLGVERARPGDAPDGDEQSDDEALTRGGQVFEIDERRVLGHGSVLLGRVLDDDNSRIEPESTRPARPYPRLHPASLNLHHRGLSPGTAMIYSLLR